MIKKSQAKGAIHPHCPRGTIDNSPALQCRESAKKENRVPVGTLEIPLEKITIFTVAFSGREAIYYSYVYLVLAHFNPIDRRFECEAPRDSRRFTQYRSIPPHIT